MLIKIKYLLQAVVVLLVVGAMFLNQHGFKEIKLLLL
jgi:hypothetical protein